MEVRGLDRRPSANSGTSLSVQLETKQVAHHSILPFGPAHWIRIDMLPPTSGPTVMSYAVQTTPEVMSWSQTIAVKHFAHGSRLAKQLGWFQPYRLA